MGYTFLRYPIFHQRNAFIQSVLFLHLIITNRIFVALSMNIALWLHLLKLVIKGLRIVYAYD